MYICYLSPHQNIFLRTTECLSYSLPYLQCLAHRKWIFTDERKYCRRHFKMREWILKFNVLPRTQLKQWNKDLKLDSVNCHIISIALHHFYTNILWQICLKGHVTQCWLQSQTGISILAQPLFSFHLL
jgi:hypothetical protein